MTKTVEIPIYITFAGSITIELQKGESLEKIRCKRIREKGFRTIFS